MQKLEKLEPAQLKALLEGINNKRYYLLLGAGVSLDSVGPNGKMLSARDLTKWINEILGDSVDYNLSQAASLLTKDQKTSILTEPFSCETAGETICRIAHRPWRRCYTLNIDNCFEKAFRRFLVDRDFDQSTLEVLNFNDDFRDTTPEMRNSIVHLHGSVETPEQGYVFSHADYAKQMVKSNAWMTILAQQIKSEPFVISGTTLEEIDVTYYLEQRTSRSVRSDTAPSILIEPYPNRLTRKLCDDHGFVLFEGTNNDFLDSIENLSKDKNIDFWADKVNNSFKNSNFTRQNILRFHNDFENIPATPDPDRNAAGFLLGGPLTWGGLGANIDISRDYTIKARSLFDGGDLGRIIIFVDEPGSGKTSFLKRLSFDMSRSNSNIFWHHPNISIDAKSCAEMFNSIKGDCFLFVDDWADNVSYFMRVLTHITKSNFTIVSAERAYRIPYIESSMSDEAYSLVKEPLSTSENEILDLLQKLNSEGFSNIGRQSNGSSLHTTNQLFGDPISIASCRIQNNFSSFDRIVHSLIKEASPEAYKAFLVGALARYCHSSGIRKSVLIAICGFDGLSECLGGDGSLQLTQVKGNNDFIIPKISVIGDRVLENASKNTPGILADIFIAIARSLAPYVSKQNIKNRNLEARLSGRLLDYDGVVKRFINDYAETLYSSIKTEWDWSARYWEQLALLKLERFFADTTDISLLEQSIQHARFALSKEYHPFSLTTLAKLLFEALKADFGSKDDVFAEGWKLICEAIEREKRWDSIKASAFMVSFNGVINYVQSGGLLTGSQTEELKDIIATTHARKFHDKRLIDARETVKKLVSV